MFRTSCEVSAMPTLTAAGQARANYFLHLATTLTIILITVAHTWSGRVLRDTEQLRAIIIPTLVTACARAIIFLLEIVIAVARGNHRRCRFCRDYYRHRRCNVTRASERVNEKAVPSLLLLISCEEPTITIAFASPEDHRRCLLLNYHDYPDLQR